MTYKKLLFFILLFFIGCSSSSRLDEKSKLPNIDFNDVLIDQTLSESERIIDMKARILDQENEIKNINNSLRRHNTSLDSLRFTTDSIINRLETQIDSFRIQQSMLIGPQFSNNIIKLYNKVDILEDKAFFMDSLYFELVTDMVIMENQITSVIQSIDEFEKIENKEIVLNSNNNIDFPINSIDYRAEYKKAHELYMSKDYLKSIEIFKFLLDNNIATDLADNCQFWIGQSLFIMERYKESIVEFSKVLKYTSSNKSDNSIYKIGLASIKIKNIEGAIEAFQIIINDYPKSQYSNSAYEFIIQLEGEK